jgi:hypothetical protein
MKAAVLGALLAGVLVITGCSDAGAQEESFAYRAGDVDAFITIPAGKDTSALVVEMPAGKGVYLSGEYLLVQGGGRVDFSFPEDGISGGVLRGSIKGAKAEAFYTPEEDGSFKMVVARGNGGDRNEPLVVEVLLRDCDTMLKNNGKCKPV